jgi:hypothetical protein
LQVSVFSASVAIDNYFSLPPGKKTSFGDMEHQEDEEVQLVIDNIKDEHAIHASGGGRGSPPHLRVSTSFACQINKARTTPC